MWVRSGWVDPSTGMPHTRLTSRPYVSSFPALRASSARSANSLRVSATGLPPIVAR